MKTFRDSGGREWAVAVNGATIVRVKGMCDILLPDLITGGVASELAADPIRLLSVLWAVCKPEADGRNIDEAAFQTLIVGDSLDGAIDALIDEVVSFFPKSRRQLAQDMVSKGRATQHLATQRAITELEAISPEKILAEAMKRPANSPGDGSGSSPVSSASTPPGSLSGS